MPQDPAILIEGVTKRFAEKVAVDNLDLVVPTGSICGFLGPNGAGKTTTIRMVMSIFHPDQGNISVLGKSSAAESKRRIGYLPEERGVYRTMKVGEFLTFMGKLKGVHPSGLSKKIDDWLERVALPGVRKKRCEELSKGMQQKVQFLAAIIHDPELIILDEPFSGLDPMNALLLRTLMDELHAEGRTIIFSTHVLSSAEQVCDRIFMINKGRKVLDGPIDGILARFDPRTLTVEPLEDADVDEFAASLMRLGSVERANRLNRRSRALETHIADGVSHADAMREIVASLPVRRVELRKATIEDIFVNLVAPEDSEDVRALVSETAGQMEAADA